MISTVSKIYSHTYSSGKISAVAAVTAYIENEQINKQIKLWETDLSHPVD